MVFETLWNPESIGERIKSERRRLGLSQDKFASAGGIKRTTLYQYEHGDRLPSFGFLLKTAVAGLDLGYIIYGKRNLRLEEGVNLKQSELDRILALVDQYARDGKGRALSFEYRRELTEQLIAMVAGRMGDAVDWPKIEDIAREFAA